MQRNTTRTLIAWTILVPQFSIAGTIRVPADFPDVPGAIAAAQAGDEILVAPGEYDLFPNASFPADNITLRGESGDAHDVILLGGGANGPLVVSEHTGIVIRAVTITDCATALIVTRGQARLENCRIIDNTPASLGTVVALSATLELDGCLVQRHQIASTGATGAIAVFASTLDISDSVFVENSSPQGISAPSSFGAAVLLGVQIVQNQPEGSEGTIRGTIFQNNTADFGAAITAIGSTLDADRCTFAGNDATFGGAILTRSTTFSSTTLDSDATITNSVFTANHARQQSNLNGVGGAVAAVDASTLTLVNNTFYRNTAETVAGAVYATNDTAAVTIANTILADNAPAALNLPAFATQISNLDAPDEFVGLADPLGPDGLPGTLDEDFSPSANSPAIDAGDNTAVPPMTTADYLGNPRFYNDPQTADTGVGPAPIVDIGAVEFIGPCNDADLAPDFGILDLADIAAFVTAFTSQSPPADLNDDTLYDLADIGLFVSAFTAGCP